MLNRIRPVCLPWSADGLLISVHSSLRNSFVRWDSLYPFNQDNVFSVFIVS